MEELLRDTILAKKEDFMVSPTGGTPMLRSGYFLKPICNSIEIPTLKLPSLGLPSDFKWPLKVSFNGWKDPQRKWQKWVHRMHSLHHSVWKKAGIYEAILASLYKTRRNRNVFFGVSERWCFETNTFLFPWGEATVTLEDMMILGGFSVLGETVSLPLQTKELVEIEHFLVEMSKGKNSNHSLWLNQFMDNESKFEHEAFLSLWLSRFVFPGNVNDAIGKHVFSIAIHISNGTRIALAPAVLASIYRDLGLLRGTYAAAAKLGADICEETHLSLTLWAPLRLVQIWAWERIPQLHPKPNLMKSGYMRLARWHSLKKMQIQNVRSVLDSAGDDFHWRPYTMPLDNWLFPNFYKEKEQWVSCNGDFDEELVSFARCLRVCELVGIDCIEPYRPHRVSMQFAMDQDLPGWVPRNSLTSPEIAWKFYSRPISDTMLYFPPRLFQSDVTVRYMDWWRKSVSIPHDFLKRVLRGKRSSKKSRSTVHVLNGAKGGICDDVPPGFPPKRNNQVEGDEVNGDHNRTHSIEVNDYFGKTNLLVKPSEKIMETEATKDAKIMETEAAKDAKMMETEAAIVQSEAAKKHAKETEGGSSVSISDNEEEIDISFSFNLEARITKLESIVSGLMAAKFGHRSAQNGN